MRTPHFRMGKIIAAFICTILSLLVFRNTSQAEISILSSKDGLSENQITAIAQDQIGRIWIGTTNGLNVFDGYSVHRIQSKAVTNTKITDLALDPSQNTMWVGTTSGLYGVHTESMRPVHPAWPRPSGNNPKQNSLRSTIKIIPYKSRNGNNFIVVFQNGQIALLWNNALHPLLQLPLTKVSICSFATFPNGDIFLFANKKSFRLNVVSKSLIRLPDMEKDYLYINKVSQYDSNQLLVSTFYKGLYLYNLSTQQITIPKFLKDFNSRNPGSVLATVDNKNGTIYTILPNYQFASLTTANAHQYKNISAQYKTFFEGRSINGILIDHQQSLWIGTNKGLIKLSNEKELFRKALQNGTDKISTRDIIQLKNKDIYVASYNGLYQYNHQNNSWQLYGKSHSSAATEPGQSLYRYRVQPYALLPDKEQKNIVIGMDGTQLLKYNIEEKQFYTIPCHFGGSAMPGLFGFAQTPSGEIKAASSIGLLSFHLSTDSILNVRLFNKFAQDQNTAVHTVKFSQPRNKIIVGTTNGLFILDTNNTIIEHFSTTTTPRLTNNDVFCFFEDNQGNIWVGTNGGGVHKISSDLKTITHINSENGLSNDIVYGIEGDNNQNLWISTFDGLNYYNPHKGQIRCYYQEQGLSTDEFNRHSSLKAADGTLYFGSINGIVSFNPKRLEAIPLPAFRVFLSGITKWDMKEKSLKYDMAQPIDKEGDLMVIKRKNDMITDLHFACSDYSVVAKNKFQYRLKGITKDWTSIAGNNSFNINGLPFGKFLLEVRAINYRGQISQNTLKIHINIVKPLYQLWWFYALVLLVISGMLYAIFSFRLHKYKSSVRLRMSIASSLHDEVGSYLTRITMVAESLNFIGKTNINKLQSNLEKLATLSREATASMSDVLWTVDSRNDFSGSLTDRMKEHAEEMFNPTEIDLIFDFSGNNHGARLPQVLRKELYLVYKEALHNIVKHAPEATYIRVEFNFHPYNFHLLITNDGAHTQSKEYGTGQGLKNIRKRARAIAAHCDISKNETNHTFSVKIFK